MKIQILNNFFNVCNNLIDSNKVNLDLYNIYPSQHGTIIVDFEIGDNIFSLEIGKEDIGYFVEIDGKTFKVVDIISIREKDFSITMEQLNNDLSEYFDILNKNKL